MEKFRIKIVSTRKGGEGAERKRGGGGQENLGREKKKGTRNILLIEAMLHSKNREKPDSEYANRERKQEKENRRKKAKTNEREEEKAEQRGKKASKRHGHGPKKRGGAGERNKTKTTKNAFYK